MPELEPCNKCGKVSENQHVNENTEMDLKFGYGSKRDGDSIRFHLCDDCFDEIISSFKIEPEIDDPYSHWDKEANTWKEFS